MYKNKNKNAPISPSSSKPRNIPSATSTYQRLSTTTFPCRTIPLLSVSIRLRTKVPTSHAPSTKMQGPAETGFSSRQWDAAQAISHWESEKRPTVQ